MLRTLAQFFSVGRWLRSPFLELAHLLLQRAYALVGELDIFLAPSMALPMSPMRLLVFSKSLVIL